MYIGVSHRFNYPPFHDPRQQACNKLIYFPRLPCHYEFCANRMRLPELDEKTVKVHPLLINLFSNNLLRIYGVVGGSVVIRIDED